MRRLLVALACASFGCAGQRAAGGEHARPEPAQPPIALASADAGSVARTPHVASVDAGASDASDAAPDDAAASASSEPPVKVEIERPYKLYERPRPKGEVLAAGQDEELARWNVGGNSDPDFISNRASYHPAPRVRVDTLVVSGHLPDKSSKRSRGLSQQRLLARARKYGYWPFRLCFEDGLRRDQTLHGKSVIRIELRANGRVRHARLRSTKLADRAVAECLTSKARELVIEPAPAKRITVDLSVELWPGDAPVPLVGPPAGVTLENPGQLDADEVMRAVATVLPEIEDCQRRGMKRHPTLWGRIQVKVVLDARGRVTSAQQDESRYPHRGVARCVVAAIRSAKFEPAKGGAITFVVAVRLGEPPIATSVTSESP